MSVQDDRSSELLFPPGSMARVIARLGVFAIGAGRAILMQLAHPKIAAGIDEHSTFKADPLGRTMRTAEVFRRFFWGTRDDVAEIVPKVRAQHARVKGDGYFAEDPDLLLWVHATTIDSLMVVYSASVRPLEPRERAAYVEESTVIAELLGCPRDRQPADLASFDAYIADTVADLRASDTGRSLARDFLFYRVRPWATPLAAPYRLAVRGYTPDAIRRELDVPWSTRHQASWLALGAVRVPLRAWRSRRERPDPATQTREGNCRTCGAVTIVGVSGSCAECRRRFGGEHLAKLERLGARIGLERGPSRRT